MMRLDHLVIAALLFLISGCCGTTPINKLGLPPVSIIHGKIAQTDSGGFTLHDKTGSIYVRADLRANPNPNFSTNESVTVYGNLRSGQEKIFDAYVIKKTTGEKIFVSNPTPHFGFVIQSSFK